MASIKQAASQAQFSHQFGKRQTNAANQVAAYISNTTERLKHVDAHTPLEYPKSTS